MYEMKKEIIIPYKIVFNKQSLFPVITSYIKEWWVVEWELKYKPRLWKCIYDISCVWNSLDEMLYKATDKLFNLYANWFDAYFYFPKQKWKNTTKK